MRLVGASNMYIRGPFIVAGIITGVLAALIALILFYPATWYAGNALPTWLGGFNLVLDLPLVDETICVLYRMPRNCGDKMNGRGGSR